MTMEARYIRVSNLLDPEIRQQARREGAQIFFADEAGVRSDFHAVTAPATRYAHA